MSTKHVYMYSRYYNTHYTHHQVVAAGQCGAVIKAICQRGTLKGRLFAIKAIFNMGLSTARSAAFQQYESEFDVLAELERHPNVMPFYTQFVEPVPESILPELPEFVRQVATINPATGRRRRRPLPSQWVVFEWLPETLQGKVRERFDEGGEEMMELPWREVAVIMRDICRGLLHLHNNNLVRMYTSMTRNG